MPWCAPDTHAVKRFRQVTSLLEALQGMEFGYEYQWLAARRARRDPDKIARAIENSMTKTAIFQEAPADGVIGVVKPRILPCTVALVSIDPTVVLLIPKNAQDAKNDGNPSLHRSQLGTSLWWGQIDCGTSFLYRPGVLWLSPGVQDEPAPLEPAGPNRFRIETPAVHLEFEVKDGWLHSTRLK